MITLTNGFIQNPAGQKVPNGSLVLQLNCDATIIADPGGIVPASLMVFFQFDSDGNLVQPAMLWSNAELNPQNARGLGTYYLVTIYDSNGARINKAPMWWQFPEAANSVVDISQMVPVSTVGGNVLYYPSSIGVSSVSFTGDGTVLSATPTTPVTSAGTLTATLNTQTASTFLAGPVSGPVAAPTFRALSISDIPGLPASIITSGVIAVDYGGSGADLSATGGSHQYVKQATSGGAFTVGIIASSDIPNLPASIITSGILALAQGGNTFSALGDLIYSGAGETPTVLSGNTTTTKNFLGQTGTGSASAAPVWGTIESADITAVSGDAIDSGLVAVAYGGSGTATPGLIEGSNITITGSWPNQTINSSASIAPSQIEIYTSGSNTWTKPTCNQVMVILIAGGGGGGSGACDTSGDTYASGGSGGGGGAVSIYTYPESILGSTETVVIGGGGAGGAAVDSSGPINGNPGVAGSTTSFGSWLAASGGAGGGAGMNGGNTADPGGAGGAGVYTGGAGATGGLGGGTAGSASTSLAAGGGGAGCGSEGGTGGNGGTGSPAHGSTLTGGAGGASGNPGSTGGSGTNASADEAIGGPGGGGGGSSSSGVGGTGGTPTRYGGGGGGGGANGTFLHNTGAGGAGAPGIAVVIAW